jgi:YggT family protein
MLKNVTDFISASISIYMLLIIVRLVLSWISSEQHRNNKGALAKLCDPYLNIFRKIPFFTIGYIDFSPIIALAVLVIFGDIIRQFGLLGTITLGIILAICIKAIWNAIVSILFFIFAVVLIRGIILLIKRTAESPILTSIDSFLEPLSSKIASIFTRTGSYASNLMMFGVVIIIIYFAGSFLILHIANFVAKF